MSKIHTQRLLKGEGHCFFDAGEINLIFIDKFDLCFLKNGSPIFHSSMHPEKVYVFKGVGVSYIDTLAFDIDLTIDETALVCFDPRIVMTYTLLAWMSGKDNFDDSVEIEDLQKVLTPLPTMDEAKDFLRKNKSLINEPIYDAHTEGRVALEDLIGVPAKVRNLFDK